MITVLWIVAYLLSALAFAYVSCRLVGDTWPGPLMVVWPFFVPILLFLGVFMWVSEKGEEHHG